MEQKSVSISIESPPVILPDQVHVWTYDLTRWLPGSPSALSPDERRRWKLYRTVPGRQRFARAHAFLRTILGLYAGVVPSRITIGRSENGKPQLIFEPSERPPLHFSFSYRGDRAAIALSTHE